MVLTVKMVFKQEEITVRILWIDPDRDVLFVIDIFDPKAWPQPRKASDILAGLERGDALIVPDPFLKIVDEDRLTQKASAIRAARVKRIAGIVAEEPAIFFSATRGKLVRQAMKECGCHHRLIYRSLRLYWQRGKVNNALLPDFDNCGGVGQSRTAGEKKLGRPRIYRDEPGPNKNEEMEKIFKATLASEGLTENPSTNRTQEEKSLRAIYRVMILRHWTQDVWFDSDGNAHHRVAGADILPTVAQLRYYRDKHYTHKMRIIAREGLTAYERNFRPTLRSSNADVVGPGSLYQIDATIGDIYLVSRFNREIVGRPVIYLVSDVFSRMIVGLYVGFEGSAMMALANAMTDKVAYCRKYGRTITSADWPCVGVPEALRGDRGEMAGTAVNTLVNTFGVRIEITPPYRPDLKGIVENLFRLIQKRFGPYAPGYVRADYKKRGGQDYRLDAVLDIDQFTRLMIWCVLEHNNRWMKSYPLDGPMLSAKVPPIPVALWEWGIANRSGLLPTYPDRLIQIGLMPTEKAWVLKDGIHFRNRYYASELALAKGWFDKAAATKKGMQIDISYDPRHMDNIYILNQGSLDYSVCNLLLDKSGAHANKTLEESEQRIYASGRQQAANERQQLEREIDTDVGIQAIVDEGTRQTEAQVPPDMSNAERLANHRENRRKALTEERSENAFILPSAQTSPNGDAKSAEIIPLNQSPAEDFSLPSNTDRLRQKLEELRQRNQGGQSDDE